MSTHVLLNLLNKLRKRDKMLGLLTILMLFRNKFDNFYNTGAQCFDLFDLFLYIPSTIFQLYRDGSSWVESVLS